MAYCDNYSIAQIAMLNRITQEAVMNEIYAGRLRVRYRYEGNVKVLYVRRESLDFWKKKTRVTSAG